MPLPNSIPLSPPLDITAYQIIILFVKILNSYFYH